MKIAAVLVLSILIYKRNRKMSLLCNLAKVAQWISCTAHAINASIVVHLVSIATDVIAVVSCFLSHLTAKMIRLFQLMEGAPPVSKLVSGIRCVSVMEEYI